MSITNIETRQIIGRTSTRAATSGAPLPTPTLVSVLAHFARDSALNWYNMLPCILKGTVRRGLRGMEASRRASPPSTPSTPRPAAALGLTAL